MSATTEIDNSGLSEKIKKEKERVIILSIASNAALVAMKLVIGIMSGLISIVAEALHSGNDLMASLIAYVGVKNSLKPPDKDHQYGHGKIEIISGWLENLLILAVGAGIIYEGIRKFTARTSPKFVDTAIIIMIISGIVNWLVSYYLIKKGKELRSVGIEVDGAHLRADVVTSFGIAAALIVMRVSGLWWIDPMGAVFVGCWVIGIFIRLSFKLTQQMIDRGLSDNEMEAIERMLRSMKDVKDFHKIRSRQSGSTIFVDMHVKVDKDMTVECSHELTRDIDNKLKGMFGDCNTLVHIEPYYSGETLE
jgi:cation diffusion facilitator family transporter